MARMRVVAILAGLILVAVALSLFYFSDSAKTAPAARTAEVEGHVKYAGKPVVVGEITILSMDGQFFDDGPIAEGQYHLRKVPIGTDKVIVVGRTEASTSSKGARAKMIAHSQERWKKAKAEGKEEPEETEVIVDPSAVAGLYGNHSTTTKNCEVKPGQQVIDIDLEAVNETK
jgi:hypothetical protein